MSTLAIGVGILWLVYMDGKLRPSVSPATGVVLLWALIVGSRPVTSWFGGTDQFVATAQSYDDGNPAEALIYLALICAALIVVARRRIRWSTVVNDNRWLFTFYLFWLLSVAWSDMPIVTAKRLFKDLGNVAMVLVVLTEREPIDAIKAVCLRCAYVAIPLSVLLMREYPGWGRAYTGYDRSELMLTGVATHKNTLAVLAFVGAVFILWDLLGSRRQGQRAAGMATLGARVAALALCWYVLATVDSATCLISGVVGSALLVAFRVWSARPGRIEAYGGVAVAVLGLLGWAFAVREAFVQSLGRDMTLTTRTDVWPILLNYQASSLLGAGFNSFWAGERLLLVQERVGSIIQAHNGYLETYLNGGWVGSGLLVAVLVSAYLRIRKQVALGVPAGAIRFVILILALIYNYSEASFSKIGLLWFVTLFAIMDYRRQPEIARPIHAPVSETRAR